MMSRVDLTIAAFAFAALSTACGASGMGAGVREDITQSMQTIEEPVAACYEDALNEDRSLRGRMDVSFVAAPETGEFTKVNVAYTELPDAALEQCVVDQVSQLSLEEPQKSAVSVTYPLDFSPTN